MKLMNHETALSNAKEIADRVLATAAQQNDKKGRIPSQAVATFGRAGLLRMMLPAEVGGFALGPRPFAATVPTLAEADASVEVVYLMHVSAAATIAAARPGAAAAPTVKEIAAGRHLSTLAFSEAGSRSHFWAPVSRGRRNAGGASAAMRACGGAAFSKHMIVERLFQDAHARAVMAPTGDVLREFIARVVPEMPLF
jgi:alkylation response protein AidB-like acyl-CoA dehydrogenase